MSEAVAIRHGVENATRIPNRDEPLEPGAVRGQLERILASKTFSRSPRISRFLTFVVDQTLAGQEDKLKEYLLGVEVFNRMDSFDPRIDSIVRVEARRLRYKLERYYETEGQTDSVLIQFRKGCYVPSFANRNAVPDDLGAGVEPAHLYVIGSPQAFSLFARGRYNLTRWTPEGVAEAISCFSQALDEDPDCVGAYSGLATSWVLSGLLGYMPPRDVMPKARERAEQAVMLRPNLSEAHTVLGLVRALYDWEWNEAEPALRKAVQFSPHDATPRLWYGLYSTLAGRHERAIHESHRGQQTAPTSLTAHIGMGFACHMAGNSDDAVLHYGLAQQLDDSFYPAHLGLGMLFTDQNVPDKAIDALTRADALRPSNPVTMAALVRAYAQAGNTERANRWRESLVELAQQRYVSPVARAMASAAVGELETALDELAEAVEDRATWLAAVPLLRGFEPLHDDPRYEAVLDAVRLPHHQVLVA